ncbi:MAG: ATP-binding protein [Acidaminococcaceae bacterium]|jgi:anti-sigma regulatory factor (Ser/Thr protein kinase)|nr:ATP-binding protein [Acidaminococcaceae bacterium]
MATLTVPAQTEQIDRLQDVLHQQLEGTQCPMGLALQLELVVEEAFVNIATHAYTQPGGTATFTCQVDQEARQIMLQFQDQGMPFNPLARPDPDTTLKAEDRKIGGLGIYLIKKTMDKCEYAYTQNTNILTVWKKY